MDMERALLLVEDNDNDVILMKRALKIAQVKNPLHVVEDGQKAIDYLSGTGLYADRAAHPRPGLVFLDLKLPFKSGHEVLGWIRQQPHLADLAVVILTSSNQPSDLQEAYRLKANSYVTKPASPEQLAELVKAF